MALYLAVAAALSAQTEVRVLVNAGVYDSRSRFYSGLKPDNFQLLYNGVETGLESVAVKEAALSAVILLDVSRSMEKNITAVREALGRFLDRARTGDEFCLLAFRDHAPPACLFAQNPAAVRASITAIEAHGGTALNDALLQSFAMMKHARNVRRAILILSDGLDNASAHSWTDVRREAMETDAVLYAVSLPAWRGRDSIKMVRLEALAEESGGRMLTAGSAKELPAIVDRLEVRQQYVLSFVPPSEAELKPWRTVQVKLRGEAARNLRVYWRHKYSAKGR